MKKLFSFVLILAILISAMPVCFAENTVTVHDFNSLMMALRSDTTVVLAPGDYIIPADYSYASESDSAEADRLWEILDTEDESDAATVNRFVSLIMRMASTGSLLFDGLQNVTLRCEKGTARILAESGGVPVITLSCCSNITLDGIVAGHNVVEYGCSEDGHVLSINYCDGVNVNNCELFGCGVYGANLMGDNNAIRFNGDVIRDCMCGIVRLDWDEFCDVAFDGCSFLRNAYDP